jgi:hypothetical protein
MRREIRRFVARHGGERYADGMGLLFERWDRAARQVERWREKQTKLISLGLDPFAESPAGMPVALPCSPRTAVRAFSGNPYLQTSHRSMSEVGVSLPDREVQLLTPFLGPRTRRIRYANAA